MEDAIKAVEAIKQKKEDDVKKLDDALEILQGVDLGSIAPVELAPEVPESPVEVDPEVPESPVEAEPEVPEEIIEAEPEVPEETLEAASEGSPFEDNQEENKDTVILPVSELKEIQDINNEIQEPKEESFGESFNNMVETTKDFFSPKKPEDEVKKGGKLKNRKSRKGLRTKRFRGGNNRKSRKGRRNSRRLRK
jgi:hypothetical protein